MPRLVRGDGASALEQAARSNFQRRNRKAYAGPTEGADADEALEELWRASAPWDIRPAGDLVVPGALGTRLRALRAEAARALARELDAVAAELAAAHAKYALDGDGAALGANQRGLVQSLTKVDGAAA